MSTPQVEFIKSAKTKVISLINKGEDPTAALEKVAKEMDMNSNFIHRVASIVNTALTHSHFKAAADRSADFPIADYEKVVSNIFSSKPKTASQKISEWFPDTEYADSPVNVQKLAMDKGYQKAYAKINGTVANDYFPASYDHVYKQASAYVTKLAAEVENAEMEYEKYASSLEGIFLGMTKHFKKEARARIAFEEFESQVFSKFGSEAVPYLDLIYKSANSQEDRGVHDSGYYNFKDSIELKSFDSLMKCSELLKEAKKKVEESKHNHEFEKENLRRVITKESLEEIKEDIDDVKKEAAAGSPDILMHFLNKWKDTQPDNKALINRKIDNQRRSMMLEELMVTDPILSKVDPRKVISAYEQILRIAPQLAGEKEIMRVQLRAAVESQGIDAFTADSMTRANSNLLDQQQKLKGTPKGSDRK